MNTDTFERILEEVTAAGSSGISACAPENAVSIVDPGMPDSESSDEELPKPKKLLKGTGL